MTYKEKILSVILGVCFFILLFVGFECIARILTAFHILSYYKPIELKKERVEKEELRLDFVLSENDSDLEYDPVLFWKPKKNWGVFNELGIRGSSIQENIATVSGCTILTYGDSNTLGIIPGRYVDTPWPEVLASYLKDQSTPFRVLNMGVMGYSSYQGLEKFKQDVFVFHPSLIIISFGWNDAAPAMGIPDNEFHSFLSGIITPLSISRLFQVIFYYSDKVSLVFRKTQGNVSRVSYSDYVHNIEEFIRIARSQGTSVLLLTRLHGDVSQTASDNWRASVPKYNALLRVVAQKEQVPFVDLEQLFLDSYSNELVDECHVAEAGHNRIAQILVSEIQHISLSCNK